MGLDDALVALRQFLEATNETISRLHDARDDSYPELQVKEGQCKAEVGFLVESKVVAQLEPWNARLEDLQTELLDVQAELLALQNVLSKRKQAENRRESEDFHLCSDWRPILKKVWVFLFFGNVRNLSQLIRNLKSRRGKAYEHLRTV